MRLLNMSWINIYLILVFVCEHVYSITKKAQLELQNVLNKLFKVISNIQIENLTLNKEVKFSQFLHHPRGDCARTWFSIQIIYLKSICKCVIVSIAVSIMNNIQSNETESKMIEIIPYLEKVFSHTFCYNVLQFFSLPREREREKEWDDIHVMSSLNVSEMSARVITVEHLKTSSLLLHQMISFKDVD